MLKRTHIIRGIGVIQMIMALLICYLAIKAKSDVSPMVTQLEKVLASAEITLAEHRKSYEYSVESALGLVKPMEFWGTSIKKFGKTLDNNILFSKFQNFCESIEKTGETIEEQANILKDYGENGYKTTLRSFDETAELLKTCKESVEGLARHSSYYYIICFIASFVLLANGIALCLLGNQ